MSSPKLVSGIGKLVGLAIIVVVTVLTITSLPTLWGEPLHGKLLLGHMGASGALVFLLPLFGILQLVGMMQQRSLKGFEWLGFWALIATGFLTIATVFVCMLPLPSTDQMHTLILWHAIAGFAMSIAAIWWLLARSRRPRDA